MINLNIIFCLMIIWRYSLSYSGNNKLDTLYEVIKYEIPIQVLLIVYECLYGLQKQEMKSMISIYSNNSFIIFNVDKSQFNKKFHKYIMINIIILIEVNDVLWSNKDYYFFHEYGYINLWNSNEWKMLDDNISCIL